MKPKHQRLIFILIGLLCISVAVTIILRNFNDNLVFFYSPAELAEKNISEGKIIRIGGLIQEGSVEKLSDGNTTKFILTDLRDSITVKYTGILPPMFREGQGMVARGVLQGDIFVADNLLTKHDEKYMPPEVADSLKKSGVWEGDK